MYHQFITFLILIDYLIHIELEMSILYFMGCHQNFYKIIFLSLNIAFILAPDADPDEMSPYVVFLLGLHCLPKYLFSSIQNEKGYV